MRTAILLLLVIVCSTHTFGQATFDTKKKYCYFKTWNWLKYYHPDLAAGKVQADSLFLYHWPAIDKAKDSKNFNQAVQQLISTLTPPLIMSATDEPIGTAGLLTQNIDTAWFTNEDLISSALRTQLRQIYKHRYQENTHYYIPAKNYDTEIPHEPVYTFADSLNIPCEYRMLALAKIQGAVDYLFPHRYLMDKNWNTTVLHFIPLFTSCNTRLQYEKCLLQITATFNDSHTFKFYQEIKNRKTILKNKYYPPFDYQLIDDKILVTHVIVEELCNKAGLKKGDYITKLGGISVANRVKQLTGLLSTSNHNTLLHKLSTYTNNILFMTGTPAIPIQIQREGKTFSAELSYIRVTDTPSLRTLNKYLNNKNRQIAGEALTYLDKDIVSFHIGNTYRFIENVPDNKIDQVMDSLLTLTVQSRGIIFDMRGYPDWGGFISYLYKKFGQKGKRYGRYYAIDKQNIGAYRYLDAEDIYYAPGITPENTPYKGKVVIIVNPDTRSMSEWNTMHLQALFPRSITIGQQTSGGDGDERMINIPGNYKLPFTGNAVFYPDGTVAQRKGVKIDIPIYPTANELLTGEDILLNKALELINPQ